MILLWQVRERCNKEWVLFQERLKDAEKTYFAAMGVDTSSLESDNQNSIRE